MKYVAIPSYKRPVSVMNILKHYENSDYILCFCFQGYTDEEIYMFTSFIDEHNMTVNFTIHQSGITVGSARKETFRLIIDAVSKAADNKPECYMHDDDILVSLSDMETLLKYKNKLKSNPIYSIDFVGRCKKNDYVESTLAIGFILIDFDTLKFIEKRMTPKLSFFEDLEITHLAACYFGTLPLLISKKLFDEEYSLNIFLEKSVITYKAERKNESIKLLQERYGFEAIHILFLNDEVKNTGSSLYITFKNGITPKYRS